MNHIEALLADRPSVGEFADRYFAYLRNVLARIERGQVAMFIEALLNARHTGARIFFLGNGGSAVSGPGGSTSRTTGKPHIPIPARA